MKITNFVKSAKTSFGAPLAPKCTRVLCTTAWQAKPKQHNSTHGTGPVLETLSYYFVALLSHCKDGQELRISCSYWWDVTFIVIEPPLFIWSSGTDVLRQTNTNYHAPLCKMFQNCNFSWFCYSASFEAIPIRTFVILISWIHWNYSKIAVDMHNSSIRAFPYNSCSDWKSSDNFTGLWFKLRIVKSWASL